MLTNTSFAGVSVDYLRNTQSGNILHSLNISGVLHHGSVNVPIQLHSGSFNQIFQGSQWQKFLQSEPGAVQLHGSHGCATIGDHDLSLNGNKWDISASSHIAYLHGNSNNVHLTGDNEVVFVDGNHNTVYSADGDLAIMHGNSNALTVGHGSHDIMVSGNHNNITSFGQSNFIALHGNSDNVTATGGRAAFVVQGNSNHIAGAGGMQAFVQGNHDTVSVEGSQWAVTFFKGSHNTVDIQKGASNGIIAVLGSHGNFATGSHAFSGSHGVSIQLHGVAPCNVQLSQVCGGEEVQVQNAPQHWENVALLEGQNGLSVNDLIHNHALLLC
ncbi:MAG: hypothetical protein JO267_03360 [Alphaproteobacteria bacterium]|nr:hypothetical protein [Alphaproteobacteria bacterium]